MSQIVRGNSYFTVSRDQTARPLDNTSTFDNTAPTAQVGTPASHHFG